MQITIKLFAALRKGRFNIETEDFPIGTTVGEVIRLLDISEKEITLAFVNGRHAELDTKLMEGDTLALFPPVGGG